VRNLQNGRSIVVRVNDRGPFLSNRLIDLSYAGAAKLGIIGTGTGIVDVEAVSPEEPPVQLAGLKSPSLQMISPAAAVELPARTAAPRLYLQVGAFARRDNAVQLRDRLEREALQPVFIQAAQAPAGANAGAASPIYRVRVGPFATVEEGDRLTQRAAQLGVANALIVVE